MLANALGISDPAINPDAQKVPRDGRDKEQDAHPSVGRLRAFEQDASSKECTCAKIARNSSVLGYNSHDVCHNTECRHVHGQMRQAGISWGVSTQLARIGGFPGHPIITPDKVGGYAQAIRQKKIPPFPSDLSKPSSTNSAQMEEENAPIISVAESSATAQGVRYLCRIYRWRPSLRCIDANQDERNWKSLFA